MQAELQATKLSKIEEIEKKASDVVHNLEDSQEASS